MLKIISLNIEHDKHLPKVIDFVQQQQPDVILLQEVLDDDFPILEQAFGMRGYLAPLNLLDRNGKIQKLCNATFTALPVSKYDVAYYRGDPDNLPVISNEPEKMTRAILITEVMDGENKISFINNHFTWSRDATVNQNQRDDLAKMLKLLAAYPEFVLCGDLNSPRGKEIFDKLAELYTDNIPAHVSTTIDKNLHRAGDLNIVVDCLFTKNHKATEAQVICGISDHCGVVAYIS